MDADAWLKILYAAVVFGIITFVVVLNIANHKRRDRETADEDRKWWDMQGW